MQRMMERLIAAFLMTLFATLGILSISALVHGAERPQMMLVLDASGSMWQRIGNKEKILIAREVVGEILDDWEPGTELGVVAYGHRRKGDCDDIETVVPVGPVDVETIRRTVNRIQPKGKTPLSAAVLKAAQDLRYTEEKATVILISDGKETCGMNPCSVGEELEKSGVDFTAHVIGFDISEEEREQLQCLAQATGGQYFDAREAEELKVALSQAVEQVKIQPDQVVAVLTQGASPLNRSDIEWQAKPAAGGQTLSGSGVRLTLPPGSGAYTVSARLGQAQGKMQVQVVEGQTQQHVLVLDAGHLILKAGARGPQGEIGDPAVQWWIQDLGRETEVTQATGPDVSLVLDSGTYGVFAHFQDKNLEQVVQLEPGEQQEVSFDFEITPARLEAPDKVAAGSSIDVTWKGPDGKGDYLSVAEPGQEDHKYINYTYTSRGNPARLLMPDRPGVFELRYVSGSPRAILARRPIETTPVGVSLSAPDQVPAGKIIEVTWEGPDNKGDYLSVAAPDQEERRYINYTYTSRGNPTKLQMPDEAGLFELRYISGQSKTALARRPITLTPVSATLRALDIVPVKEAIRLEWQGPDNKGDYLAVAEVGSPDNKYLKYIYTSRGDPAKLNMPDRPGNYELRYVSGQSKTVLARRPVQVVSVAQWPEALVSAPDGEVVLKAIDANSEEPFQEGLNWTLYGIEGGQRDLQRTQEAQPQFSLPAGIYRANVIVNGASESLEFILNPGESIVRSVMVQALQ